jgi:hypothetical protein
MARRGWQRRAWELLAAEDTAYLSILYMHIRLEIRILRTTLEMASLFAQERMEEREHRLALILGGV